MNYFNKLLFILSSYQKRQLKILSFFLFIGMLFEMAGLGVLLPTLTILMDPEITKSYPSFIPIFKMIGNPSYKELIVWGMFFLFLVYFTKSVFLTYLNWRQSKFSSELSYELSSRLFYGYLKQSYIFHLNRNSSELLRNVQGEVNQFSAVSQASISLSIELSALLGIAFVLFLSEPFGASVVIIFLGLSSYIFHFLTKKRLLKWGKQRQEFDGAMNQHLLQGLGGVKDVKLMGSEDFFLSKYSEHCLKKAHVSTRQITLQQLPRFYLEFMGVTGMAGLVILMILQDKPIASIISIISIFLIAAFRMIPSAYRIMGVMQQIRFAKPVIDVLYGEFLLINAELEKEKADKKVETLNFKDSLEVSNICYRYPGGSQYVLKNISFSINRGQSVGFIGPSGQGKSTLLDVLLGLLIPESGNVMIDKISLYSNIRAWQDKIGYVPQSIFLIDDSIRRNIAFGIDDDMINEENVFRAVKSARLDDLINTLEFGLETMVGERGVRLSGGQRQRIGIARALYRNPEILILDEATSSLDATTEKEVMNCITDLQGKLTILIVAHRLTTVAECDRIYELQKKELVDMTSTIHASKVIHN